MFEALDSTRDLRDKLADMLEAQARSEEEKDRLSQFRRGELLESPPVRSAMGSLVSKIADKETRIKALHLYSEILKQKT